MKRFDMANTAEYRKEYYYANREKHLGWAKGYRERNKEKVRAAAAAWRKKNPEKSRAANAKYRDKKCIEKAYNEWNDTLRELGYGDLVKNNS
jgi:hypothetical protein